MSVDYGPECMKLVIDLPKPLVKRIRTAVERGGYENAKEFAEVALENQLELEESNGGEESFTTLDEAVSNLEPGDSEPSLDERTETSAPESDQSAEGGDVTDALTRRTQAYSRIEPLNPPGNEWLEAGPLWGQYNRIFPTKLVVRYLANVQSDGVREFNDARSAAGRPELKPFQRRAAQIAREYGFRIQEVDEQRSRGRGEKLASGLPTGDREERSLDRFVTHFVTERDSNGKLRGATAKLRFVNVVNESASRIGLTEFGTEFARLPNPLIDESPGADEPLSANERSFYLDHVRDNAPREYEAMVTTAEAIADGTDRPTPLTERVHQLNADWTQKQANTMRTGLVSRMNELQLLQRERAGQRGVRYVLTGEGERLVG